MLKPLRRLKAFVLNLLFPLECLHCGREGHWLCPECSRLIKFGDKQKYHNLQTPSLDKIFIAGDYNDSLLADTIKKFKYNFIPALGKPLADFLTLYWTGQLTLLNLNNQAAPPDFLLMPIPLSAKRLRWRGFNQAEVLARALAENFSYPLSLGLVRPKHRPAQAALNENQRRQNISGVFSYRGPNLIGRTVILIDDVATTGATLNEAALTLRAHGAAEIYGLVLAKG